ncbi:MAG: molybdenum cofactor guanylyltransferase [Myxococcota bacterium]
MCGGASRRMGRDKAWLDRLGQPLLTFVVEVIEKICDPVVVVRAPGQTIPDTGRARVVEDSQAHGGPLAGFATGLRALPRSIESIFLAAADSPLLSATHVHEILCRLGSSSCDVVCPLRDGQPSLFFASYRMQPVHDAVETLLRRGERRLGAVLEELNVEWVEGSSLKDVDAMRGVNTVAEWRQIVSLLRLQ